jgi:uncharacterized protein YhaN
MKILRLDLKAFGPFTNQEIDLSSGNYGLHVIYGLNEAGKSSSLRAINAVLFGISRDSKDDFLHEKSLLRVGSDIACKEGKELSFLRKKGNKNTLLAPTDNEPITDKELEYFLNGITEERFFSEFALNHDELVKGGVAFLSNKGEVGQCLFAAGHGLVGLSSFMDEIKEQAGEIYSLRKRKGIAELANQFKEQKKESKQSAVNTSFWDKLDKEYRKQQEASQEITAQMEQLSKDRSRFERLSRTFPLIIKRNICLDKLSTYEGFAPIPESITEDRKNITNSIQTAKNAIARNEIEIKQLVADIGTLEIPDSVLQRSSSIKTLLEELGSYKNAKKDVIKRQGEYEQIRVVIDSLLDNIKSGMTLDDAQSLNLRTSEYNEIQSVIEEYNKVVGHLSNHNKNLKKVLSKRIQTQEKIDKMENPLDISLLKKEMANIMKQGDMHSMLNKINNQLTVEKQQISIEMGKMGIESMDIDKVAKMIVPDVTVIEKYKMKFDTLSQDFDKTIEEIKRISGECEVCKTELKQLHEIGNVFSVDELKQIRDARDEGWEFIKKEWLKDEDISVDATEYLHGLTLDQAYERDIKKSDEIADSRYEQAEQVAKVDQLNVYLKALNKSLSQARTESQAHQNAMTVLESEWKALWVKSDVDPGCPNEMQDWYQNLSTIRDKIATTNKESVEADSISKEITTCISRLNKCLDTAYSESNLNSYLSYCGSIVEKSEQITQSKNQCETRISEYKNEEAILQSDIKDCELVLEEWNVKWSELTSRFGLNPDNSTKEVTTMIHQAQEVFLKQTELDDKKLRIKQMKNLTNSFEEDLAKLLKDVAPDLLSLSPLEASGRLRELDETTKSNQIQKTTLEAELKKNKITLDQDNATLQSQYKRLDELCTQAACGKVEELISKEEKSANVRTLAVELHNIDDQLIDTGGGSVDEINIEVASTDRDAVNAELENINSNMKNLIDNKTAVDQAVGELKNQLEGIDGGNKAAEAAEDAEVILTKIKEQVRKYLKLTLALKVLEQEIECYRKKNENPLLAMASEYYMKLTLGSFNGLAISYEGEQPAIVGVRPDNRHTEVDKMSDGSRDQLYLSLRLATLATYLETSEPMPFIVDDILIKFDDDRAKATLEILSEISNKTQVLFFTHQARHIDIAKEIDNTFIHYLTL